MVDTVAQKIAELFQNDGQKFNSPDTDDDIDTACRRRTTIEPEYRDGYGTDTYRFNFDDGSSIVIQGDCWDIGYRYCYCGQNAGHNDDCDFILL